MVISLLDINMILVLSGINSNPTMLWLLSHIRPSYIIDSVYGSRQWHYAGFLPVANVPIMKGTPTDEPAPAPPSTAVPKLAGIIPLLAATKPATAPALAPPSVIQSVFVSPSFSNILHDLSCHSICERPLMRPHVATTPAIAPNRKLRPEYRSVRAMSVGVWMEVRR